MARPDIATIPEGKWFPEPGSAMMRGGLLARTVTHHDDQLGAATLPTPHKAIPAGTLLEQPTLIGEARLRWRLRMLAGLDGGELPTTGRRQRQRQLIRGIKVRQKIIGREEARHALSGGLCQRFH
ncbi:MAG: hypothetical protein QM688_01265 [Sphingomonas bacterium]